MEGAAKDRRWLQFVISFIKMRVGLTSKWAVWSKGILESKDFAAALIQYNLTQIEKNRGLPPPHTLSDFHSPVSGLRLTTIYDIYKAATMAKPIWDQLLYVIARRMKIEMRYGVDGFEWYHERIKNILRKHDEYEAAQASGKLKYDTELSLQFKDELENPVCGLITMPLKDRDRARQKAFEDYGENDPGPAIVYLNDIVRASIICITEDQIAGLLKAIYTTPNLSVISVKNRFKTQCPNGYRDILVTAYVNFVVENNDDDDDAKINDNIYGFICELQIHHYDMYYASLENKTYQYYKYFRTFFGTSGRNPKQLSLKLKVLKKMDQISNDSDQLDQFMRDFLESNGRASRELDRLIVFYELFKKTKEHELAEMLLKNIMQQLKSRIQQLDPSTNNEAILQYKVKLVEILVHLSTHFRLLSRFKESQQYCEEALGECTIVRGRQTKECAIILLKLSDIYSCQNMFNDAGKCCSEAHKILSEVYPEDNGINFNVLNALQLVAENLEDRREWVQARDTYKLLLSHRIKVTGKSSPDVAATYTILGNIEEFLSNYNQSIEYHSIAKDMYEAFYGADHAAVSGALTSIAHNYDQLGMIKKSLSHHFCALETRQKCYNHANEESKLETNDHVADSYSNIALLLFEIDNIPKSVEYLEKALKIREAYNKSSPSRISDILLATSMNNLAKVLTHHRTAGPQDLVNLRRALNLLTDAYTYKAAKYGVKHVAIQQILYNQAVAHDLNEYVGTKLAVLKKKKEAAEAAAIEELERQRKAADGDAVDENQSVAESVASKSLADDSVTSSMLESSYATSVSMSQQDSVNNSVAASIAGQDDQNTAPIAPVVVPEEKYASVLDKSPFDMLSAYQGDQALNKCIDIINEMVEFRDKSEYDAAMDCYASLEAEIRNCRAYNENNVLHALLQSQLGCLKEDQNMYPEAQKCFEVVLGILYNVYGEECIHPYIASSLMNYAGSLKAQYKYDVALDKYLEAHDMLLKLYRQSKGETNEYEDTDDIANCLHCLSQCFLGVEDFEKAVTYCEEAYDMRCRLHGPDHPDATSALNTMGIILLAENRLEEAEELFEKVLKMREKVCGQKHQAYGTLANNVAMANYVYFDLAKAGRTLCYSMDIKQNHIGPHSLDYLTTLRNLMSILSLQNDKEYLPFIENAERILSKALTE